MKSNGQKQQQVTLFGCLSFLVIGVGSFYLSEFITNRLYLIYHYGWAQFRANSLTFIQTSNGHPWIVSNGDQLTPGFGHFLISAVIWMFLFMSIFLTVIKILGRNRRFRLMEE